MRCCRQLSRSHQIRKGPMDSEMEPTDQGEKLPRIDVCRLYLFFLSARHLHFPAAVYLVLATSAGLFMLSMITGTSYATAVFFPQLAVVFLEIAWFCCFRPAVVVSAKSRKNRFLPGMGSFRAYPSSSPKKDKIIREGNDIICNYERNAAKDMDVPFDNVSLGQFIRICGTSVDSCFERARSRFF